MKHFSIVTFCIFYLSLSFAQIPNNDFELWEPDTIYEKPVGWTTNNGEFGGTGVTQDTNAYSGNYAIRLSSGTKNTIWAEVNFSINFHPKILNAYVKTYRVTFDSSEIKVYLFHQGILVDSADTNIKVYSPDSYFLVSLPVSNNAMEADSAVIQLSASSPSWSLSTCILWVDHLWFDDQVGIQNISPDNLIQVFPNPAKEILNISFSKKPQSPANVTLTDAAGVRHLETTLFQHENQIDISTLKSGIYFLSIKHEEEMVVKKIIKL